MYPAFGQTMTISVHSAMGGDEVNDLYDFLDVERYAITCATADTNAHDVVLVMRSVWRGDSSTVDTISNTLPWKKKVVGGFPWEPDSGATFMYRKIDSLHARIKFRFGMGGVQNVDLPAGNHGYRLADGIGSYGEPVEVEMGKPIPIMVLTQPYPDPPAPAKPIFYRYCFSGEVPPDQWPGKFGVPHLFVFELTVVP